MDPKQLKIKLIESDLKQVDLAREYGCSPQAINDFINGKKRSRGLIYFIAHKMAIPPEKLIPETNIRNKDLENQTKKAVLA